jgi:phosphoglycolate phosphatase
VARPFDAVVFDLDGTLVDTAPDLHFYLNGVLAELGRPALALDEIRPMIGDGARALLQRGLEASGGIPPDASLDQLFATFLERYTAAPARLSTPFAGLVQVLDDLAAAEVRLGVCTNKPQRATDRLLADLGLARYFGAVLGGDALPVRKPDPGPLLAVLQRLDVAPERAVLVGDSRNDLLTARGAGVPCVLVSFGYTVTPARALDADQVIDAFAELPAALAGLARR